MRGLTIAEREFLLDAASAPEEFIDLNPNREDYDEDVARSLERRGLFRWIHRDDGMWTWQEAAITELGRIALRCCTTTNHLRCCTTTNHSVFA